MTREEAKHRLLDIERCTPIHTREDARDFEALEMAIKALEQEPCEDAISRQAAQAKIKSICDKYKLSYEAGERKAATGGSAYALGHAFDDLPPVNPQEPKTGHWIRWYEQKENDWYIENIPHCKCSECGKEYDSHSSQFIKYCNECGAKMESEDKE